MLELRKEALTWAEKENNRFGNTVIDNKVTFFKKKTFLFDYMPERYSSRLRHRNKLTENRLGKESNENN